MVPYDVGPAAGPPGSPVLCLQCRDARHCEFPAERAFHYVVETQQPRQRFTCSGIAAAFLVQLFQATGDVEHHLACERTWISP